MTKEKYNTKDIRHIDEKNQEYIAKCNRMTEEKYQNGDIHWNTYSGKFKMFDKDGNEIKFPTEDTGYQVKLDVQGILNLYEENKGLKRIEELRIAQIENLKQENKELKKQIESQKGLITALEEIREDLVKLKTNDEDDFTYEYSKIEDKINKVLNLS